MTRPPPRGQHPQTQITALRTKLEDLKRGFDVTLKNKIREKMENYKSSKDDHQRKQSYFELLQLLFTFCSLHEFSHMYGTLFSFTVMNVLHCIFIHSAIWKSRNLCHSKSIWKSGQITQQQMLDRWWRILRRE